MFTGEIFTVRSYQVKMDFKDGECSKMELHFVVVGENGTFYNGAGTYDWETMTGENIRIKCK